MKNKDENFAIAGAVEYKGKPLKCDELYAEEKLDGIRMVVVVSRGKATAYSRGGCEMVNARYITREIEQRPGLFQNCVLDGEAIIFDSKGKCDWNLTLSVCNTETNHPDAKRLQYMVFDFINPLEWANKKGDEPLWSRKQRLTKRLKRLKSSKIHAVRYKTIKADSLVMRNHLQKMINKGVEGSIFKKPDSVYSFKKNTDWLKLKPVKDADLKIVGMKPGKKGKTGQMLGLVGSLEVEGIVEGTPVRFFSSGMNMDLRKKFTALHKKKKLVGKIVEIHHEGLTVKNKVRFPRFIRVREDKTAI